MLSIIVGFIFLYFLLCINNEYLKEGAFFTPEQNKKFVDTIIQRAEDLKKKSKNISKFMDKNDRLHKATTKVAKKHMDTITKDSKKNIENK